MGDIALRFMGQMIAHRAGSTVAGLVVPADHATRGVALYAAGTAEGYVAAAEALLHEAFKTLDLAALTPDGTPLHEWHARARAALQGLLSGFGR